MLFSNLLFFASCFISIYAYQYDDQEQRSLWDFNRDTDNNRMIIEGYIPEKNEFPWMVYVTRYYDGIIQSHCSGSILSSRYILTARHCVNPIGDSRSAVTVKVGSQYKSKGQTYLVKDIYSHNPQLDIAVLKLQYYIDFNYWNTAPVCLSDKRPEIGETLTVAGFGRHINKNNEARLEDSYVIGKTKVLGSCSYKKNKNYLYCAGGLNSGTASGDSGGPVMTSVNGRICQVGIAIAGAPPTKVDGGVFNLGLYYVIGSFCNFIKDVTDGRVKCQHAEKI